MAVPSGTGVTDSWIVLAQQSRLSLEQGQQVLIALGGLVLAGIVLGLAFWALRYWLSQRREQEIDTGFSLDELRRLHRDGELTDEQYKAARAVLLARGMSGASAVNQSSSDTQAEVNLDEVEPPQAENDETQTDDEEGEAEEESRQ